MRPKRNTLPKSQRLNKKDTIKQIFKSRETKKNHSFRLHYQESKENQPALAIIVKKKDIRLAVKRNKIKRLTKEVFRKTKYKIPPYNIILINKTTDQTTLNNQRLQQDCQDLLNNLK